VVVTNACADAAGSIPATAVTDAPKKEMAMTVSELQRVLEQCNPSDEVLVRMDYETLESLRGNVFEIESSDYSYGCTDTLALMLECGQPEE